MGVIYSRARRAPATTEAVYQRIWKTEIESILLGKFMDVKETLLNYYLMFIEFNTYFVLMY